jgi:uncharacterized protein YdaU (DUF1376 family)
MTNVISLRADLEVILKDEDRIRFLEIDWHIGDWIGGTLGMSLEIEGAYCRLMNRLYQAGKPLPNDDRIMSQVMGLSLRIWKRIKDTLVEAGKILIRAGCITNSRFEKERQRAAERTRQQSANAQARWSKPASKAETSAKFAPSLPETSPKLSPNSDAEISKIKDLADATAMPTTYHLPLTTVEEIIPNGMIPSVAAPTDAPLTKRPKRQKKEYSKSFGFFWDLYPNQVGKGDAFKVWDKLSYDEQVKAYKALKVHLPVLEAQKTDLRGNFCAHPATWLRQRRFDDPAPTITAPAAPSQSFKRFRTQDEINEASLDRMIREISGSPVPA